MSPRNAVACRTITRAPVLPEKIDRHCMKGAAQKGCSQLRRYCSAVFLLLVVNAVGLSPWRDQIRFVDTLRLSSISLVNSGKQTKLRPSAQEEPKSASKVTADKAGDGIPAKVVLTTSFHDYYSHMTGNKNSSLIQVPQDASKNETNECSVVPTGSTAVISVGGLERAPVGAAIAVGFMKLHFHNTAASKPTAIMLDGNAIFKKRILENLWLLEPDFPTFAYILELGALNDEFRNRAMKQEEAQREQHKKLSVAQLTNSLIREAFHGGTLKERSYILLTVTEAECQTEGLKRPCFGACTKLQFFDKGFDPTTFAGLIKLQTQNNEPIHDNYPIVNVFLQAHKNKVKLSLKTTKKRKAKTQYLQRQKLPIIGTPIQAFELKTSCDDVPIIVLAKPQSRFYIEHGGVVRYIESGGKRSQPITPIVTPQAQETMQHAQELLLTEMINQSKKVSNSLWGIYSQTDKTKATDREMVQTNEPLSLSSKNMISLKSSNTVKQDATQAKKPERITMGSGTSEQSHKPQSVAASAQYQPAGKVSMPHKNVGANSQQVKSQGEKRNPKVLDKAEKTTKAANIKTLPPADYQHHKASERTKDEETFPAGGKTPTTHTQGKGSRSNTIPKAKEEPTRKEVHINTMKAKEMPTRKQTDISTLLKTVPFLGEVKPESEEDSWKDEEPNVSVKKTEASPEKHGAEHQKSSYNPSPGTHFSPKSHEPKVVDKTLQEGLLAKFKNAKGG